MLKYLYRTCPKCGDYLGVVVPDPPETIREIPIDAYCAVCGFKLNWKIIRGRKKIIVSLCLWILFPLITFPIQAYPHGGGLDSYGCHYNRRQGEYHCHRGMFAGQQFSSKEEMLRRPHAGKPSNSPGRKAEYRTVKRVVDGDTIILDGRERVRLIGVDTPETKHPQKPVEYFGREASAFTRKMVQGKRVRLEFDPANTHIGHKDRYKRTLAYVFLEDGTFLNAEIVKQGYGHAYTRFPFKFLDEFRRLELEARE